MILPSRFARKTVATAASALALLAWSSEASAQRRGRPVRGRVTTIAVSPYYFGGYWGPRFYGPRFWGPTLWGPGFYDPFWWGMPGWGPWGYPGFYGRPAGAVGSARLQVTPREAEVYVDGHFTGVVDNFDGLLQRLDVPPGPHTVTLRLDGYRTVTQRVLFRPGATISIKYEMERLAAGEIAEPPPAPEPPPSGGPEQEGADAEPLPPRPRRTPPRDRRGPGVRAGGAETSSYGTLAIRVQPDDATVVVDGEPWEFSEGEGPLELELSAGEHVIEVRKDGYRTYWRTVQVRAADTTALNVSLSR